MCSTIFFFLVPFSVSITYFYSVCPCYPFTVRSVHCFRVFKILLYKHTHIRFPMITNPSIEVLKTNIEILKFNVMPCADESKNEISFEMWISKQQHHVFDLLVWTLFGWSESIFKCLESFIPNYGSFSHRKVSIRRNKTEKMKEKKNNTEWIIDAIE